MTFQFSFLITRVVSHHSVLIDRKIYVQINGVYPTYNTKTNRYKIVYTNLLDEKLECEKLNEIREEDGKTGEKEE